MADKHHGPGIVTLLVYLIGAASLTGGLSGWVHASGAYAWLTELNTPNWAPAYSLINIVGLFMPAFGVIALWIVQHSGRDGSRTWASLLVLLLLAGMTSQIIIFFSLRDVSTGFVIALGLWVYALLASHLVSRSSRAAGVLLWMPLAWHTFLVVLGFELMRLNNGSGLGPGFTGTF
ncbi:TspO/MBR family protein [Maricaulis parjimensis]|uniref:TspO/MBR family protein n=1 Tax=Maricaulis parjimensis TaxID=144023 RepID=UPI00193ABA6C|nr:TspO/MBR family protein [Maricaulis parjimensis]